MITFNVLYIAGAGVLGGEGGGGGVGDGREQATISGRINSQRAGAPHPHEYLPKVTFWFTSGRPVFWISESSRCFVWRK